MNRTHELREQIDACRSGSDDLSLPELAKLRDAVDHDTDVATALDRSQRFDRTVMSAMQDVEIPAGLADRLLKAASAEAATGEVSPATIAEPSRRKSSRRNWLIAIGSIAALLLLGVTFLINSQSPRRVSQEELAQSVSEWERKVRDSNGWVTDPSIRPPKALAVPPNALNVRPIAWRRFDTEAGESGVVYRLNPTGKQAAYLFVLDTGAQYSVGTSPFTKVPGTTARLAAGAWQNGGTLYVVVVHEVDQRLEDYLRQIRLT